MLRTIAGLAVAAFGGAFAVPAVPADAAVSVQIVAHFDLATRQQPENITLEPDGSADVTFAGAGQVARVHPDGRTEILATFPAGGSAGGIVRTSDGTLYVNYRGATQTGVWRIRPGQAPALFAALPDAKFPNGLALGPCDLYVTDSAAGAVWRVPLSGATPTLWAQGGELSPRTPTTFGSNGVKVHDAAVWVSNTDFGTLLRIPIRRDGSAGTIETKATGIGGIDDFAFEGNSVLAALNPFSEVIRVLPDGSHETVLTAGDGLRNPTSVAVRGNSAYVASAAYFTRDDPNLLKARVR